MVYRNGNPSQQGFIATYTFPCPIDRNVLVLLFPIASMAVVYIWKYNKLC